MSTTQQVPHDVRAVANYMLDRADARGIPLTLMQLLKLLYIAHGWSFALLEKPIIANQPQAWQYGPVYPHVYKAYNGTGSGPIRTRIVDKTTGSAPYPELSEPQKTLIDDVLSSYGNKHAFELSGITHKEGTPWKYTFDNIGIYKDIPAQKMAEHYIDLRDRRKISTERYKD